MYRDRDTLSNVPRSGYIRDLSEISTGEGGGGVGILNLGSEMR